MISDLRSPGAATNSRSRPGRRHWWRLLLMTDGDSGHALGPTAAPRLWVQDHDPDNI